MTQSIIKILHEGRIDLLDNDCVCAYMKRAIKWAKGSLRQYYGSGNVIGHYIVDRWKDSTTVFSPYFIATVPISVDCGPRSLAICSNLRTIKSVDPGTELHHVFVKKSRNFGTYVHAMNDGLLFFKNLPKNETIFVNRGTRLFNLWDYKFKWTLEFGDRLIWIATADRQTIEQNMMGLREGAKKGNWHLFKKMKELFTVETTLLTYEQVKDQEKE